MDGQRKHVIRKYANRKLYDTRTSHYVTLDGISELLRMGEEIQVIERDTGRDLTPLILSQIVASEEKRGAEAGDSPVQERGQALLGYVRRTLSAPAALVSGEVERRRGEVEELVELAVERALKRLSIPSRRDLDRLSHRLDALEKSLEAGRDSTPGGAGSCSHRAR